MGTLEPTEAEKRIQKVIDVIKAKSASTISNKDSESIRDFVAALQQILERGDSKVKINEFQALIQGAPVVIQSMIPKEFLEKIQPPYTPKAKLDKAELERIRGTETSPVPEKLEPTTNPQQRKPQK